MPRKKPSEPSLNEAKQKAPTKRKRRAVAVTNKAKGISRIPPDQVDPAFLSVQDMERREMFCQAYVAFGTLAKSAETAGYKGSQQVLRVAGYRLYNEPWVKARIEQIRKDKLAELNITQTAVLAELQRIGFADIGQIVDEHGELLPLGEIPEDTRRAISGYKVTRKTFGEDGESIEKEVKFEGKRAALEKLGQHAGLFGKEGDRGPGISAEDFARALGEGMARVLRGKQQRVIEHQS